MSPSFHPPLYSIIPFHSCREYGICSFNSLWCLSLQECHCWYLSPFHCVLLRLLFPDLSCLFRHFLFLLLSQKDDKGFPITVSFHETSESRREPLVHPDLMKSSEAGREKWNVHKYRGKNEKIISRWSWQWRKKTLPFHVSHHPSTQERQHSIIRASPPGMEDLRLSIFIWRRCLSFGRNSMSSHLVSHLFLRQWSWDTLFHPQYLPLFLQHHWLSHWCHVFGFWDW